MAKKHKEDIPRPAEDIKTEAPEFNAALSSFLKKHTKKPDQKKNDDTGSK
jgi:hypothetical protein